jgi:large subunit ribosomal protein L17
MRHRKHRHVLGVKKEHRSALLSNLAASLIKKGRIKTTLAKARALRPFIERIVTKAKLAEAFPRTDKKLHPRALYLRRLALSRVRDDAAITLLFDEKVQQFTKRSGGYSRIYKLSTRRVGDAAEMAIIEFVGAEDPGYKKSRRRKGAAKAAPTEEASSSEAAPAESAAAEAPPAADTAQS